MVRDSLKSLSRRRLSPKEYAAYHTAILQESDRAAAIILASNLEDILQDAIVANFPQPLTAAETEQLFSGDAPLSTFSAKIKIAYALQLVDHRCRAALNCIRDIRNAFAHSVVSLTFHEPAVISACSSLDPDNSWDLTPEGNDARRRYTSMCMELDNRLVIRTAEGPNSPQPKWEDFEP